MSRGWCAFLSASHHQEHGSWESLSPPAIPAAQSEWRPAVCVARPCGEPAAQTENLLMIKFGCWMWMWIYGGYEGGSSTLSRFCSGLFSWTLR